MEIQVKCRSQERKKFIENCARFFARELRLNKSRYSLIIRTVGNLGKNRGSNGEVLHLAERQVFMLLDSRLSIPQLLITLAHEMVHVKQIAKGQYKGKTAKNGRLMPAWRGVIVRAEYLARPWEIEAIGRQMGLVEKLLKHVSKKMKSKRKR